MDREAGELVDWIELMLAVLNARRARISLRSGPLARILVRICFAEAVTIRQVVLFSEAGWLDLERRSDRGLVLLAHELAHVEQYRRHGVVRFLLTYVGEYLDGRLRGGSHRQAYLAISYERQARRTEEVAVCLLREGALLKGGPR